VAMFFKKSKGEDGSPGWANFFTPKEYKLFLARLDNYFRKHNVDYRVDNGIALLDEPHLGYDNFGLINLAQICKQDPQHEWDINIENFFRSMERSSEFEREFESRKTDFEFIRPFIAVRIYNIEYADSVGRENFIYRQLSEQVVATLVFDLPDSIMNIKPENIIPWQKRVDELFTIGYENAKESYPIEIEKQQFGNVHLWMALADHFFAPNILLSLHEEHNHLLGTHGALVGVPHRHIVLIYPIEDLGVLDAIHALVPTVYGMNQEGPGSISHELFWYKDGEFHNLPYELEEQKMKFIPPDNFVELLNSLEKAK
jgi:hypothetical protein